MVGRFSGNFVTVAAVLMLVAGVALAACSRDASTESEPTSTPPSWSVFPTPTPDATPAVVPLSPVVVPLPPDVSQRLVVAATPVSVSRADQYMVLVPSTLRSGHSEGISVSLLSDGAPAARPVQLRLMDGDEPVAEVSGTIDGSGMLSLPVPQLPAGQYRMEIEGPAFTDSASVKIAPGTLVLLETDKPIYKPGQTIHVRLITLDTMLRPWPAEVTVEVQDAKGNKVYRTTAATDDYGMASVELPLSTEPNLGVWKVTATLDEQETQLDVRVEEYVLPKYEVIVSTTKDWVLADEPISGTVSAEYTFGKPVQGELEIVASRYVGEWEEYATLVQPLAGETTFELPPVQYVAGVPGAGGLGNVTLKVTVREKSTGYEEETTRLLTVASAPVSLKVIPESGVFKPSLPMSLLVITETPDGKPVDEEVQISLFYMGKDFDSVKQETVRGRTDGGKALVTIVPPEDAVALNLEATAGQAHTSLTIQSGYSPSGNFIHLEQVTEGPVRVGDTVEFHVSSTKEAANFYYEVLSRGRVIFSDVFNTPNIALTATQLMAPSSRLLVYQILPNNEVAADFLPFSVEANYPHKVKVAFGAEQVKPGEAVDIEVQTEGPARVGLVAVDKSVFILAENRLNLRQVFDELERLYLEPRVELHEAWALNSITTRGASETFEDAGLVVMTNMDVPDGEEHIERRPQPAGAVQAVAAEAAPRDLQADSGVTVPQGLAEVQRVRQFFPETWLWTDLTTDEQGHAVLPVEAPDSITTWMLRAVGLSKEHGFGVDEAQLTVFQPFFLQVDLPFSAIRGEEFPIKIALYNYLEDDQEIFVAIEEADWFDLLDDTAKSATVKGNDIGGGEFTIRPNHLGTNQIKVTARSAQAADAVIKDLIVEPEGVAREIVENLILSDGDSHQLHTLLPPDTIDGSGRAYVAITGSYLTQTIEGLEGLLRMPFGCGEQNMVLCRRSAIMGLM